MKRTIAALLGVSALLVSWEAPSSQIAPRMSGKVSAPECVDAMAIAKHMYASTSTYVYAPLQLPDHLSSTMILGAKDVDISGGDALADETDHFESPRGGQNAPSNPKIHWGKDATPAGRIVLTSDSAGWRGDMYSLYVLPNDVTPSQLRDDVTESNSQHHYSPLVDSSWRTPLVFWSKITQKPWIIVVDEPYEQLGQWQVLLATSNSYQSTCLIKFWPDQGKARAPRILPKEVREFASLLDQTLGYEPEQGTLQPTARLRMNSQHIWRNAAYRPWALSESDTYNSKKQVDDGLLQWSHTEPSHARMYARIQRMYPAAEAALSRYYGSKFKLSHKQAKQVAHWVLDVAYRSNFVFSGGNPSFMPKEHVALNPWIIH
ncbi:hypothetical protein [Frateuria defendens]|uniref:hypothetical protein n=1 Tax=Frateuria defendens TaxID=2219559 RepID=UPI001292EA10|nr:hypothetical protein [Frateuria defendens]